MEDEKDCRSAVAIAGIPSLEPECKVTDGLLDSEPRVEIEEWMGIVVFEGDD